MCNLNIFVKSRNVRNEDKLNSLVNSLSCATADSYCNNSDGDGIYFDNDDKLVKSLEKVDLYKYADFFKNSNFMITHQRLSTSGHSEEYTQPFVSNDFVLAHNGIIDDFAGKHYSDTFGFFKKFLGDFENRDKRKTRENSIKDIVKKYLDYNDGSYSIVLFDKKERVLYYFKNGMTDIHIYRNKEKEKMVMTTKEYNLNYFQIFGNDKYKEIEIRDYSIYKVYLRKKKVKIKEIGELEKAKESWERNIWISEEKEKQKNKTKSKDITTDLNDFCVDEGNIDTNENEELAEIKHDSGIISSADLIACDSCRIKTHNLNKYTGERICDMCIEEMSKEFYLGKYSRDYISYV